MLSAERVRDELIKLLGGGGDVAAGLRLYRQSGVLERLLPELSSGAAPEARSVDSHWERALRAVESIPASRPLLRLAALAAACSASDSQDARREQPSYAAAAAALRNLMGRLRFSRAEQDRATHLVAQLDQWPPANPDPAALRHWLRRIGPEHLHDLLRLRIALMRSVASGNGDIRNLASLARAARAVVRQRPALAIGDLAIDGKNLQRLGLKPGPIYGEILRDLLNRVIDEPQLNEREALLEMVRQRVR